MRRVLIAEDELDIRSLARLLLELADHEVFEAPDGHAALTMLAERKDIDVLLLDLRLPGRDGWEVMSDLRTSGRIEGLRVVVFSAQIEPRDFDRAQKFGAVDYLTKPFSEEELLAAVTG